jgi:hypothetical protein
MAPVRDSVSGASTLSVPAISAGALRANRISPLQVRDLPS